MNRKDYYVSYYQGHKEQRKDYQKKYYLQNKPIISEKRRKKRQQKPSSRSREIGIAILKFLCNPLKFINWRR